MRRRIRPLRFDGQQNEQANTAKPSPTIESKTTETIDNGVGNTETKTVKTTTIETKDANRLRRLRMITNSPAESI